MSTPNSMYNDTSLYGGIAVTSADIIKIFCDLDTIVKISRSILKIEHNKIPNYYTLTDADTILKFNGTAVRVRAIVEDLDTIYLFDAKTDAFIGIVKKTIKAFGDVQSMKEDGIDKNAHLIMNNGNIKHRIKKSIEETVASDADFLRDQDSIDLDLEVLKLQP